MSTTIQKCLVILGLSILLSACGDDDDSAPIGGGLSDFVTGLVASYPCNGDVNDATGTADGTEVGGFTYGMDRFNNANSACSFDGVDAKVTIGAMSSPGTGFSVSFWAITSVGGHNGSIIYGNPGNRFGFHSELSFTMISGATNTVVSPFPLNAWAHFVGTYESTTDLIKIYRDGAFVTEAVKGGATGGLSITALEFGQSAWPAATYWTGSLDDIRIYGQALTDSQVSQLYNYQLVN